MTRLIKRMQGGQKGFTLIELLVVIAILGVISAVVALNIAGFFGRGTLEAANTEHHQAQTAIIAAMADARSNNVTVAGTEWTGQSGYVTVTGPGGTFDAATYVFGPFKAGYTVNSSPMALEGVDHEEDHGIGQIYLGNPEPVDADGWGGSIQWNPHFMNWAEAGTVEE